MGPWPPDVRDENLSYSSFFTATLHGGQGIFEVFFGGLEGGKGLKKSRSNLKRFAHIPKAIPHVTSSASLR
jgi:hypothetical protein